jgi:predicted nucleic acid-binding protein
MSDAVVIDANLALKWVLLEEDSTVSMGLLDKWTDERKEIIAPALFAYEVTNILHRQAIAGKLTYDEALQGLSKLFSLGILLHFSLSAHKTPILRRHFLNQCHSLCGYLRFGRCCFGCVSPIEFESLTMPP